MRASTPSELQPGQIVGGYTIESVIASGGMGTVYRARKVMLDKTVALKVLHPSIAPEQDNLARFLREAKVAANLDHPAVIKVFDVGQDNGLHFMAMEFVNGTDLKSLVCADGPFSPRKALRIVRQVAEVLAYAHDKGLIHRDVKPANILITDKNEVKLADFGLARLCREDNEVTMAGTILGTPAFMSPEQCRGAPLDGRTDLYSLGATFYYLLSGKVPFAGDNPSVLIHRVVNEPPPPLRRVAPNAPDNVVGLVQRLMAKLPHARFADGYEVVNAIDEVMVGRNVSDSKKADTPPAPATLDIRWTRVALVTSMAAMLGIGAYFVIGSSGDVDATGLQPPQHAPVVRQPEDFAETHQEVDPGSPIPGSAETAAFAVEFEDLQKEATKFVEFLSAGALDKIDAYLDVRIGSPVRQRKAAKDIIDTLVSRHMESVRYRTQQKAAGKAWTVVTFSRPSSSEALTYTISWTRANNAWYVENLALGEESR